MALSHFFLPHPQTHKKAHLLSFKALLIYISFFVFLQLFFTFLHKVEPNVLGVSNNISYTEVIRLTNVEREKKGLAPLKENAMLNVAAFNKGENMFEENYWAHYSPSGKDPWGFIKGAGYNFSYAGENLARNFSEPQDVVDAWMASPTHRDNILNSHYTEIGISVVEGDLQGKSTLLVVQEFGKPTGVIAQAPKGNSQPKVEIAVPPSQSALPKAVNAPPIQPVLAESKAPVRIDPFQVNKTVGLIMIAFIATLIMIDLIALRKRTVFNLASRHASHFALLGLTATTLINSGPGQITQNAVTIIIGR